MIHAVLIAAALLGAPQLPAKARTPALIAQVQRQPKMALDLVVTGPKESQPGDLVVLDSSNSQGVSAGTWTISPLEAAGRMLVVENGSKVVFATATPARYVFYFSGCTSDGKTVRIVPHEVVVGGVPPNPGPPGPQPPNPGPNPGPAPPIPPGPAPSPNKYGLAVKAKAWAESVSDPKRAEHSQQLAGIVEGIVAQIGAGTMQTRPQLEAALTGIRSTVDAFPGFLVPTRWKTGLLLPIVTTTAELFPDEDESGRPLTYPMTEYAQALSEIATGLRGVR